MRRTAARKVKKATGRTVQSVKNSLKFKAKPKVGLLSVRVGVKKYQIPVEARMLSNEGYMFLSFSATSELYKIVDSKTLKAMGGSDDAAQAFERLNPVRKTRTRKSVEIPAQLADALKKIPAGYKLGYGTDGVLKMVKTRKRGAGRRKKS